MAAEKNSSKIEKNSIKPTKKSNRGRPKLPFYIKWQRSYLKHLNKFQKKLKKTNKSVKKTFLNLKKSLGFKKGRGRPKLSIGIRLRKMIAQRRHSRLKNKKKQQKKRQNIKRRLLQFLHLKKKAGRPKNPSSFRKKLKSFKIKNLFFSKKEVAYVRLNLKKVKRVRIRFSFISSTLITFLFLGLSYGTYDLIFKDLPAASDLTRKEQNLTTRILDRHGEVLYRIYEDENRTLVPLSDVSQDLINATIAIEDKNFYQHFGFSFIGIARALWKNSTGQKIQGGSTITQQLVKKRLLTDDRTIKRKLRELLLSLVVEGVYEKDQILEMYLNTVPYGGSTYGIEETSWRYFNKRAKDLTLAESALLAGLPQAPRDRKSVV